jgi:LPS export ABC transporter protein LptC
LLACIALAACGKVGPDRADQVQQAADSADQLMIGVKFHLTNEGVNNAYLEADTAFEYDNSGHTDLKKVKVTFYTPTGVQTSVLTADSGWYRFRTQEMMARGNVVVVKTDGSRLFTSALRYDQSKNEVSTSEHYTFIKGDTHGQGDGFVSDPTFSNIITNRLRGSGGSFRLPGQ